MVNGVVGFSPTQARGCPPDTWNVPFLWVPDLCTQLCFLIHAAAGAACPIALCCGQVHPEGTFSVADGRFRRAV